MSILFATPCYGHQMYAACAQSYLALEKELNAQGIRHAYLFTGNESLITRARNTSVAYFLASGYGALMFIDADIEFNPEDVAKLWNIGADVAVGAYPMKKSDMPPVSAWVNGKLVNLDELRGPTAVDYAGTGFMLIRRSVFEKMIDAFPGIAHLEGMPDGKQEANKACWAFFNTEVVDDVFLSEDYLFCKRWRGLGGEIVVDPTIRLKHWGIHRFS